MYIQCVFKRHILAPYLPRQKWGCSRVVIVKVLDCRIIVSEFKLQSYYYIHFQTNTLGKGMNPLILPAMGYIVLLLFFEKDRFGIE